MRASIPILALLAITLTCRATEPPKREVIAESWPSPKTHVMDAGRTVKLDANGKPESNAAGDVLFESFFRLDQSVFKDYATFKDHLKKLPAGSVLEWQLSCCEIDLEGEKKLRAEMKEFADFARKQKLILIVHMAG